MYQIDPSAFRSLFWDLFAILVCGVFLGNLLYDLASSALSLLVRRRR